MSFFMYNDKIVNLDSVTNIIFENNKCIFNLDYSVSLNTNVDKLIPDYVYFYIRDEDMEDVKKQIEGFGWLKSSNPFNKRIVNPSKISFVKFEESKNFNKKNRIIINLRNSVSFNRDMFRKTSDFVYFDYDNYSEYIKEVARITDFLMEIK